MRRAKAPPERAQHASSSSSSSSSSPELLPDSAVSRPKEELIPKMDMLRAKLMNALRGKVSPCLLQAESVAACIMHTYTPHSCSASGARQSPRRPTSGRACPSGRAPCCHTQTRGSGAHSEQARAVPIRGHTHTVLDQSGKTCNQKQKASHRSTEWLARTCLSFGGLLLALVRFCRGQRIGEWATERIIPGTYVRRYRLFRCTCAGRYAQPCEDSPGPATQEGSTSYQPNSYQQCANHRMDRKLQRRRAARGPKSLGWTTAIIVFMLSFTGGQAVPQKPRVAWESTAHAGASTRLPDASNHAKPCGEMAVTSVARKRAFRKAQLRAQTVEPGVRIQYRGRWMHATELGLRPNSQVEHGRSSRTQQRVQTQQRSPCPQLSPWPPEGSAQRSGKKGQGLYAISLNLGGITTELYDELCRWLELPEVAKQLDIIFIQETWRQSADYQLPSWSWISSGSKPVSGQGVAILINKSYASPAQIRYREVRVGRILQVQIPAKGDAQGRFVNLVNVYNHSKVSESQQVYGKREVVWNALDKLIPSKPRRHYLCIAGDFNTDLPQFSPLIATSFCSKLGVRTPARDQHRFIDLIKHNGLCALNAGDRKPHMRM